MSREEIYGKGGVRKIGGVWKKRGGERKRGNEKGGKKEEGDWEKGGGARGNETGGRRREEDVLSLMCRYFFLRKGAVFSPAEARKVVTEYIKKYDLIDKNNKRYVF